MKPQIRKLVMGPHNPTTRNTQIPTATTTTTLRIVLILPAMGIKRFTSHRRKPTTIRANKMLRSGIIVCSFSSVSRDTSSFGPPNRSCTVWCREFDEPLQFHKWPDCLFIQKSVEESFDSFGTQDSRLKTSSGMDCHQNVPFTANLSWTL